MKNVFFLLSVSEPFFSDCMRLFKKDARSKDVHLSCFSYCNKGDNDLSVFDYAVYFKDVLDSRKGFSVKECLQQAKRMEEEYQFVLSDLIHAERNFDRFGKQDAFRTAVVMALKIEEVHSLKPIEMVVSEGLDDFLSMFLYFFSKKNGVPFRYPVRSRIGTGLYLSDGPDGHVVKKSLNKKAKSMSEAEAYIENYLEEKVQPSYMVANRRFFKVASKQDILTFGKMLVLKDRNTTFHAYQNPSNALMKRVLRIINASRYASCLSKNEADLEALSDMGLKYFIYPLHFHPEASTLIKGRWINNQLQIIEFISKSLPSDCVLLVKEHKVSIGRRQRSFYNEVVKHHNVMLVSHKLNPHDLIKRSCGVVTISSSMGLEAIFHDKAVICFGDVFYNRISGVVNARNIAKMNDYVLKALGFKGYSKDEVRFLIHEIITSSAFPDKDFSPHKYAEEHCEVFLDLLSEDIDSVISGEALREEVA
ncbi:Capsule polysaccharide biosynthesis protein [Onishia taeanensis]|uniref:Capsule polysaccharide biosynthesis protein n=1 Tax=Onishia taeanensis TaxID=284577 RepID=A0A1G7Q430_9GAMM|nr:hypothetical protein [Halomonas taeanensis]SDF93266.1 Capsule polysaccharide biosynthesis protein [Halomonas taeanensis]